MLPGKCTGNDSRCKGADSVRCHLLEQEPGNDCKWKVDDLPVEMYAKAYPAVNAKLLHELKAEGAAYAIGYNPSLEGRCEGDIMIMRGSRPGPDESPALSLLARGGDCADLPADFDPRVRWPACAAVFGRAREQGLCGSCWAFSTTGAFNDRACIATNGRVRTKLSVQHMASCCDKASFDFIDFPCSFNDGCGGGYPRGAWQWLERKGVVTGGDPGDDVLTCAPYAAGEGESMACSAFGKKPACLEPGYPRAFSADRFRARPKSFAKFTSECSVKTELMEHGPMTFCMRTCASFNAYVGGVYDCPAGCATKCNHAMKLVGWGEEAGRRYWLIQNSWGTGWGLDGFARVAVKNRCDMQDFEASQVTSDLPEDLSEGHREEEEEDDATAEEEAVVEGGSSADEEADEEATVEGGSADEEADEEAVVEGGNLCLIQLQVRTDFSNSN